MAAPVLTRFSESIIRRLEQSLSLKYALSCINMKRNMEYTNHKPKQADCINVLRNQDVIACLPTGYGKSLIFESLSYQVNSRRIPTILLINPLNSIILEQKQRYGHDSVWITPILLENLKKQDCEHDCRCELCKFKKSDFRFVMGHPEHFLTKTVFDIFKCKEWQDSVSHIVVDEAHCIEKWGKEFRTEFNGISKLRSSFPHARVLALTGTATENTCQTIRRSLCLRNVQIVKSSVTRDNIKLQCRIRPPHNNFESYEMVIGPLIKDFLQQKDNFAQTVIYSKLKWCAAGYQMTLMPNEDGSPVDEEVKKMVSQYHAPCTEKLKADNVEQMSSGSLRLLFATEAYSMGTDAPDIRNVVHYGVPSSLETYLQEVGRAGRNGSQSTATLYYNKYDIGNNMPIDNEIRDFVVTRECRWQNICKYFGSDFHRNVVQHDCCDNCEKQCDCLLCCGNSDEDLQRKPKKMKPNNDYTSVLKSLLLQYFEAENDVAAWPCNVPATGLSSDLIENIICCTEPLETVPQIQQMFPFLKTQFAENIVMIIQHAKLSV